MTADLMAHLWQSTLFAFAAALLTLGFRKNTASVRFWLWLSASLKFFAPFGLLMGLGGHLGWTPIAQRMVAQSTAAQRMVAPDVVFAVARLAQPFPEPSQFAPPSPGSFHWIPVALLSVWVCGFVVIALLRLRSWLRVRAAVQMSAPLQIPAGVEIRSSPGLLEPGVVGFLRPVLLLPEGIIARLTPSQLETVIAHELCHVRRRDNLFASIHMIVEAVFWFHPVVWWIGGRMVEERERACDEAVLTMGREPRTYADAILTVCKLYVESPIACVSGVTGANLKRRIEAIMINRTGQGLNRARKLLLAAAGIAALAGPVAVGVVVSVGNAPLVQAHPSPAAAAPTEPPVQPAPVPAPLPSAAPQPQPQQSVTPTAPAPSRDHRLMAMLFDLDTMSTEDRARARQGAARFGRDKSAPDDLVAVLTVSGSQVKVVQDFTAGRAILESSLAKIEGGEGISAAGGVAHRLATIETTARMLGRLPGKKSLIYFASGIEQPGAADQAEVRSAIDAAVKSNVAIYTIDVRGLVGNINPQFGAQVAAAAPQPAAEAQAMAQGSVRIDGPPLANYERVRALPSGKSAAEGPAANHTAVSRGVPDDYQIGAGDTLDINIWKEPDASVRSVVVRPDGNISMPLLKEIDVAGLTPIQLEKLITDGLSKVINSPDVTVVVTGINSKRIYVNGILQNSKNIYVNGILKK
jgi:beta-lactamase regulating signal transducer with metallopeptidase domain